MAKKLLTLAMVIALLAMAIPSGFACVIGEPRPSAAFGAEPTSGTAPLQVQFTDQSTGEITDWQWDFDNDGTVDSTEQSPSYTYDTSGTYTVSLEVTGPGGSDEEVKAQYIEVLVPTLAPQANFTAEPTSGIAPLHVQFTDQSTGEITDWKWDFDNDGTVDSTEQSPSPIYDTPGIYTVSLEVTGPGGSDEEVKAQYIEVLEPTPALQANFTAEPTSGTAPLQVQFTDQSTGEITDWQWDFDNDGTVDSTEQSPSHTYDTPGAYTVSLEVTGPGGSDTETKADYITVTEEETIIYLPMLAPLSGSPAVAFKPAITQWEAFVRYINGENPIPGVTLEIIKYDSQMSPTEALAGYQYLRDRGAKFIAFADSVSVEALKATTDADKFPVFSPVGTTTATADPGYTFCIPMEFNKSVKGFLKWLGDTWPNYPTKPRIGCFGWNMTWGNDIAAGAAEYIQANPDKFIWDGARLMPYGTSVWGAELTSALSNCDYVIAGAFAGGLIGFVNEYRTAGYDGTFVLTDQNIGFWPTYVALCGKGNLDGTLWPANGRYWTVDPGYIGDLLTDDVIPNYCTDEEKAYFVNQPLAEVNCLHLYYITELLREAVKQADSIDAINGESLYNIAQTLEIEIEGYPTLGFSETVRSLLHYTRVYEYSALADDFQKLSDWVTIPGFE